MRKLLGGFLISLAICGCDPGIDEGEVFRKDFIARHTIEVSDMPIIIEGIQIPQSHTETVPDEYVVHFRRHDERHPGKYLTNSRKVSRQSYESISDGDWMEKNKEMTLTSADERLR